MIANRKLFLGFQLGLVPFLPVVSVGLPNYNSRANNLVHGTGFWKNTFGSNSH